MSNPQSLDTAALQRLKKLGGAAFVIKMIDLFVEYGGSKIAEARAAQTAANIEGVERAVHSVKSSAGNVGARRVQQLAQEIETMTQQKPDEPLEGAIAELEQAFNDAKAELESWRLPLALEAATDH